METNIKSDVPREILASIYIARIDKLIEEKLSRLSDVRDYHGNFFNKHIVKPMIDDTTPAPDFKSTKDRIEEHRCIQNDLDSWKDTERSICRELNILRDMCDSIRNGSDHPASCIATHKNHWEVYGLESIVNDPVTKETVDEYIKKCEEVKEFIKKLKEK